MARLVRGLAVRGEGRQARLVGEGQENGVRAASCGEDAEEEESPAAEEVRAAGIPGLELVEAGDEDYADGYEWYALVTDLDMDARDVLPLYRERGDCENIFDEMKNQWGWSGFTAHSLKQTALFAGMSVIAANLWNVFTRLGDDGMHHEAVTSRPLLQSCIARLSRHARQGIVTIYTATSERAREICRAISAFLSLISSASQLSLEERRQRIIAHAFREYGAIRRLFPPDIGGQMTMPLS